jgi:hypothetical protein
MSGIADGLFWSSKKSEQEQQSKVMRDYVQSLGVDIGPSALNIKTLKETWRPDNGKE